MKRIIFDGVELCYPRQIQDALAERLELPAWYGRNLDALYDCLGDIWEDTEIVLRNWENEGYQGSVLRVMRDIAEENEHLHIAVECAEE